jgi:hypothetical protein
MRRVVQEASLVYSGASSRFGDDIGLATLILVLSSSVVLIASLRKGQVIAGVLWFMVLAIPFMLHFIAGATGVPLRSLISLSYSAWLMVLIILTAATRQGLVWMAVPLISIYLMQLISLNSQYIASASLTQRHDELLAADIYRRLGELDDTFDGGDVIMVDFFGHKPFETVYAVAWSSAAQGSFFDWGNGNTARMLNYMKILGYQNLRVVDQNVRTSLTPTFLKMPVWPARGSVAKVDGIYLIRLSGAADPGHQ